MNPRECECTAKRCDAAAAAARERLAVYVVTFGGASDLAQYEERAERQATQAARAWRALGRMHPRTRARLLRTEALPVEIFGY